MKVFFIASARTKHLDLCRRIHKYLSELDLEHTTDFMLKIEPKEFYKDTDEKAWHLRYKKRLKEISQADICVFESSMHSLAVGQLVQQSIRSEKPTIILHNDSFKPYFFSGSGAEEKRLLNYEYTEEFLKEVLEYAVEQAKDLLTTRFTMLLSPEYTRYLDEINKSEGISRSEYIRNLIDKDMKKRIK